MKLIIILTIIFSNHTLAMCLITSPSGTVVKNGKEIIGLVEDGCQKDVTLKLHKFLRNTKGKLRKMHLKSYFESSVDLKENTTLNIVSINSFLKQFLDIHSSIRIEKASNIKDIFEIKSIDCRCNKLGMNNAKITYHNNNSKWISLNLYKYEMIYKARLTLTRFSNLQKSHFKKTRVKVFKDDAYLQDITDISNFKLNRNLSDNQALLHSYLSPKNLVKQGVMTTLELIKGDIFMTKKVIPKKNGKAGDFVDVIDPKTRKHITAKVISDNRVRIEL